MTTTAINRRKREPPAPGVIHNLSKLSAVFQKRMSVVGRRICDELVSLTDKWWMRMGQVQEGSEAVLIVVI